MTKEKLYEIRRNNVLELIKGFSTNVEFAKQCNLTTVQVSRVISKPPNANIGNIVAKKIEVGCNKAMGWLDVEYSKEGDTTGYDLERLAEAVVQLNQAILIKKHTIESVKKEDYKAMLLTIMNAALTRHISDIDSAQDALFSSSLENAVDHNSQQPQ